jgi:DNA-binding HxlR family transcriptional regulator
VRSYAQHCAAARALDVIGDRWSLLIVRELLLRECRFSELADGLPGIASNLLTERLRWLETSGVLERIATGGRSANLGYRLTPRGRELAPVMRELVRWGAPLMTDVGDDAWRGRWAATAVDAVFADIDTTGLPPIRAHLHPEGDDESVLVVVDPGQPVTVEIAQSDDGATVRVHAPPQRMLELLLGHEPDAQIEGDAAGLMALIARGASRPPPRLEGPPAPA